MMTALIRWLRLIFHRCQWEDICPPEAQGWGITAVRCKICGDEYHNSNR